VAAFADEITAQEAQDWFIGHQLRLPKPERWKMELPEELRGKGRTAAPDGGKPSRRRGRPEGTQRLPPSQEGANTHGPRSTAGDQTHVERPGAACDQSEEGQAEGAGEAVTPPAPAVTEEFIFAPSGNGYLIKGFGEFGHLSGYKGLHDIARLIGTPGGAVSMLELVGADDRTKADRRSTQAALDVQAMKEIKEKLDERRRDLDRAREENNSVEVNLAEKDIEELTQQVRQAKWFGGKAGAGKDSGSKDRDLNNLFDKLRPTIHNRLKAVYTALRQAQPAMSFLADHFEQSISSEGGTLVYRPGGIVPVWKLSQK
jgi:hypothetical protein